MGRVRAPSEHESDAQDEVKGRQHPETADTDKSALYTTTVPVSDSTADQRRVQGGRARTSVNV
jgi:hypothetical protein